MIWPWRCANTFSLDTPKQPLIRSKDLSCCVYDTLNIFGKQIQWLVAPNVIKQNGERKGWAQKFKFPALLLHKWPENFYVIFQSRNSFTWNARLLKIKCRILSCDCLNCNAAWTSGHNENLLFKGGHWLGKKWDTVSWNRDV